MEYKTTSYTIDGVEYKTLDEIPPNIREKITPELIENAIKESGKSQSFIFSPLSSDSFEFKLMKWINYVAIQSISMAENQALRTLTFILGLINVNVLLSAAASLIIGQISYSLAKIYHQKEKNNLNIQYSQNLEFLEKLEISAISGVYSFVLNLLFFLLIFLVRKI